MSEQTLRSPREFFAGAFGLAGSRGLDLWKNRRFSFITDRLFDWRLRQSSAWWELVAASVSAAPQRILIAGVQTDRRQRQMRSLLANLGSTRHSITRAVGEVGNRGKLENINLILQRFDLAAFDWVIVIDDDIAVPAQFTDLFMSACLTFGLKVAMPAHRFNSFSGYEVTRRGWSTLARATRYVEVGPLTAFHRDTFAHIFPLPELRYGWGVDLHWPVIAEQQGWSMGVVDATAIRHLNPVGGSYSRDAATQEACEFLARAGHFTREKTFQVVRRFPA